ncbi:hypothetical protein K440DRAFT_622576, partial [Wilcoxina mikolae CBS 423.85]
MRNIQQLDLRLIWVFFHKFGIQHLVGPSGPGKRHRSSWGGVSADDTTPGEYKHVGLAQRVISGFGASVRRVSYGHLGAGMQQMDWIQRRFSENISTNNVSDFSRPDGARSAKFNLGRHCESPTERYSNPIFILTPSTNGKMKFAKHKVPQR